METVQLLKEGKAAKFIILPLLSKVSLITCRCLHFYSDLSGIWGQIHKLIHQKRVLRSDGEVFKAETAQSNFTWI